MKCKKKCLYCGKELTKSFNIGPGMDFCNEDCSHLSSLEKYPGTSLSKILERIRPDLVLKLNSKEELKHISFIR